MRTLNTSTWRVPLRLESETLLQEMAAVFALRSETEQVARCDFRDSFDWRLYRANMLLVVDEGGLWRLVRRTNGEELARTTVRGPVAEPRRLARLPAGHLRNHLQGVLGVRALLPLAGVRRRRLELGIENNDAKIVVRLVLDSWGIEGAVGEERLLLLEEVRGYGEDFSAARDVLLRLGLVADASLEQVFILALRAAGREPLDYSAKFQAALLPEMPAGHALRQIGSILLAVMRRNEQGILGDVDSEFLHDFRVAIRRIRAALGQFKDVLSPETLAWLLEEFGWLGRLSNQARDLDVLLQREDEWNDLLPQELRPGLQPFFTSLARRRRHEYRNLVRGLTSERYRVLTQRWQELVRGDGGSLTTGPRAGRRTQRLARRIIKRRWRRILNDGAAIYETSPPETLHRLRIQCKKLRYALEFFRSVLPGEACHALIAQLKGLQDNLGSFNDLSVQESVVRQFLAGLDKQRENVTAAAAAGGLLACLDQERKQVRQEFATAFAGFAGEETTRFMSFLLEDAPG